MTKPGLRERKKRKTREVIQREAMRLFSERGYDATTIEQIADAAEVSQSTFFRYFPTKEDVVLLDDYDPMMAKLIIERPAGESAIAAVKAGLREATEAVFAEDEKLIRDRIGAVASLRRVDVVPALPKTRSGKILRKTMRGIADGRDEPVPSTIEDPTVLDNLKSILRG